MLSDAHYSLAFALRKAKPWKKLYDSQIFAIRHSDGQISYCSIMGHNGDHLALALYPGESGLHSLRAIFNHDYMMVEPYLQHEMMLAQDCLMVSFESKAELMGRALDEVNDYCHAHGLKPRGANAYPVFERFRPHYYPWHIEDEADQLHMLEGMEAAMDVVRRLETQTPEALGLDAGDPDGRSIPLLTKKEDGFVWESLACADTFKPAYAAALLTDELAAARARQAKMLAEEWGCAIVMHGDPLATEGTPEGEEPQSAPFFPYVLMVVSLESGLILSATLASNPEDYAPEFTQALLKLFAESGRPRRLLCKDERTFTFLSGLADHLSLRIEQKADIDMLDDMLDHYVATFSLLTGDDDPDGEDEDNDEINDEEVMAFLHAIITHPEALQSIPDNILRDLLSAASMGALPFELAQAMRAEQERRQKH